MSTPTTRNFHGVFYDKGGLVVNVKHQDFAGGAKGDGVTDDTAAIQAALNVFSGSGWNGSSWGTPSRSGRLVFPEGVYLISSTLVYNGGSNFSIIMEGAADAGLGTTGSTIRWNGAPGGTMFYAQGICRSVVRDLTFDGAQSGKNVLYCIQIDAKNTTQAGSPGSQAVVLDRVMCRIGTFASSAAFTFGHGTQNDQNDTMVLRDCFVQGAGTTTTRGILILGGGNLLHFSVLGGTYTGLGAVLECQNIYGLAVRDTTCLSSTLSDFIISAANQVVLSHVHAEQEVSARFISNTGGPSGGPSMIHIEGCTYNGVAPADDFIVSAQGAVIITGGNFINTRTGSSVPKIQVASPRNGVSGTNLGGIHSRGAMYQNADNTAAAWPFWDRAGTPNMLATGLPGVAGVYYDLFAMGASLSSFGDYGGTPAAMIPLISQDSSAGTRNFTKMRSAPNAALTDVSADAAIGLRNSDAIKFKDHTLVYTGPDLNGLSMNASDQTLVGDAAGILTSGPVKLGTVGNGFFVKEGANATMGLATLVAGTVVVSTTKVTATSRILLTHQTVGGTAGFLVVSARTGGTSFTILSSNAADTSTIAWLLVEPA